MQRIFFCFALFTIFLGTGCSGNVTKADYKDMQQTMAADAAPVPVLLRDVEIVLPVGAEIGFEKDKDLFCGWPRHPVGRSELRDRIEQKFIKQTFHDALESLGYDVVGSLDVVYDIEDEIDRAEYSVTAKIKTVELDLCQHDRDDYAFFFTTREGVGGEFYLGVDWTVYDALRRKVVYKTTTEGYTKRAVPNKEGLELMLNDAFEMAAHNLGADQGFYDLVVNGIKAQPVGTTENQRPRLFDPLEIVTIRNLPLSHKAFTESAEDKIDATVMIQKFGHGTGFFISKDGYILTNAHLVGDGLRTRIITRNGDHKLIAEIIRIDKARDVALLKLETIPDDFEITTLPVRISSPSIGEDVYTVGNPKDYRKFQGTLSKGIISAHRKNMKWNGISQNFIQADVAIHKGSDGGPLIDVNGNIIGIAVDGKRDDSGTGIGLNLFIPIAEALAALDVNLQSMPESKPLNIKPAL